ncbi:Ig-like domain-containing protein [Pedobacter montanisoli]|uniref:Ig-like domain-containing protein n=1 Tax=Pedobacter montanisoli TaxID=2923277 RepID=A0ABS9ZS51_9SPHI|nr:Ig-like domain-containing protein [Pedobacter montanisoli]MCJ0741407.1 Ig-like domain-containing protein [Pedobacter montanisoli]
MKQFKIFLLLFISGITMAFAQQADTAALSTIINKTKKLATEQPIEKVYLHFDKPYYAVADTVWFKAYVTTTHNFPSELSKIVYVEMYNQVDSLVQTLKLPVKNSVAYGNIPLSINNFKQGNYYIRAYTLWMLNSDPNYFFNKSILIGEAIDKELITNISYNNVAADKGIKTTARIQFKDINKKPLANKTVNWRIFHNYDVFTRGKGTTDANGYLTVTVTSKAGEPITKGSIVADVSLSEKSLASATFNLKQNLEKVDFQFFPEGGELLADVPNQVGFKVIGTNGLGIDVKGSILDEQNTEVVPFTSSFAGIGSFYFTPATGKKYKAKYTLKDGSTQTIDLPAAQQEGIGIQIQHNPTDMINLRVLTNASYFEKNKDKTFYLVGQNTNNVCYGASLSLKSQVVNAKISKENFPSGIVQFTLFNENKEPISERLVFVLHKNVLNIAAKADLPQYKPRQKVKLSLDAKSKEQPVAGDFSVSVVDEQKVPFDEDNETTILSSLLLTSDLKGYVEKPNYYFNKTDDKKLADLDRLMLTQGYRRFSYKNIMANKYPDVFLLPEQGISISGTLRDLTGMPVKKGIMRMMVTGKPISAETVTSNLGVFHFNNLVFPDSSQVVITARYNPNYTNLMIMLDGMPSAAKGTNLRWADERENIDTLLSPYLTNSQKQYRFMRTLKEVEIKGSVIKKASHRDYPALSGLSPIPDRSIDANMLTGCSSVLDCLKALTGSFTYDFNEQKFYVSRDYNTGSRVPASIFLNGMPVDAVALGNLNGNEVESIELFLSDPLGTIDRTYNTKGVIVVNVKKAPKGEKISKQEFLDMIPKKYEAKYSPMGYSKQREFYSPKYLPNAPVTNNDLRTTIYWNPKVITDEKGNTSLEFYNADGKGTYKVVVEGFDKNGNVARTVLRYSVK